MLNYIINILKCEHIFKLKNKINYFVNDKNSLLYIILFIFNYINLNNSKFHYFILFKKVIILIKDNNYLFHIKKLIIIQYKKEINNMSDK